MAESLRTPAPCCPAAPCTEAAFPSAATGTAWDVLGQPCWQSCILPAGTRIPAGIRATGSCAARRALSPCLESA